MADNNLEAFKPNSNEGKRFSTRKIRSLAMAMMLVLTFSAGVGVDRFVWDGGSNAGASSSLTELPEFETFQETWNLIHDHYIDTGAIDDSALIYAATAGMVEALGDTQHSTFLDPATAEMYQRYIRGELIGIGVELDYSSGRPVVTTTIDGSSAEEAGIKANDTILEINGQSTEGVSKTEIARQLRGDEGTTVTLTLQRDGETQPYTVDVTRKKIEIKPVTWGTLPNRIQWIKVHQFSVGATDGVKAALKAAAENDSHGYVLDLRGNPGGLAAEAIGVTSQFLPEGKTVYMVEDRDGSKRPVLTLGTGLGLDLPMIVIVDEGSASSAEIVASSLRDNGRAQMIGEKTFGTGTILTPFPLADGSIAVIGTNFWLTPNGELAWHKGIEPDLEIAIAADGEAQSPSDDPRLSKAELEQTTDDQLKAAHREVLAVVRANT